MNRGISTSSTSEATSASRILRNPIARTRRRLGHDAVRVGRIAHPDAHPAGDVGGREPLADHLLVQEVLGEELLEALAELVLAPRDQRRVRDRQPERVPEQGGHREPVGDGAHHARLGARVDEAQEPVLVEGDEVDHGREEQQTQRHALHPAQSGAPYGVGLGVGGHQGCGHGCPKPIQRPLEVRIGTYAARVPHPLRTALAAALSCLLGSRARRRTHRRGGRGRTRPSARGVRTARVQPVRGPGRAAPGCPSGASGCTGHATCDSGVGRPHHGAARPAPGPAGADRRRPPYGRPAALALHPGSAGPEGLGRRRRCRAAARRTSACTTAPRPPTSWANDDAQHPGARLEPRRCR